MKENKENRALLIKLFGEKWIEDRDRRLMKKEKQLKLEL